MLGGGAVFAGPARRAGRPWPSRAAAGAGRPCAARLGRTLGVTLLGACAAALGRLEVAGLRALLLLGQLEPRAPRAQRPRREQPPRRELSRRGLLGGGFLGRRLLGGSSLLGSGSLLGGSLLGRGFLGRSLPRLGGRLLDRGLLDRRPRGSPRASVSFSSAITGLSVSMPRSRATVRARARSRLAFPRPAVFSSSPVACWKRRPNSSRRWSGCARRAPRRVISRSSLRLHLGVVLAESRTSCAPAASSRRGGSPRGRGARARRPARTSRGPA